MSESTGKFRIVEAPIDTAALTAAVSGPDRGAIATFIGAVRNHHAGRRVTGMEYHAYPAMAERVMREIGADIGRRFGPAQVAIHHRVGRLQIGDSSVVIVVAAPHRREALAGCAHGIERLKAEAPIWKKEYYADGLAWIEGMADKPRET